MVKPTCCYANTLHIIRYAHREGETRSRRGEDALAKEADLLSPLSACGGEEEEEEGETEFAHPKFAKFEELNL